MRITAKITARFTDKGRLKAIATVCLDERFLITGVRVADCAKGLMVFMPSHQLKNGEFRDICFPIKPELHQQIKSTVLAAYARAESTPPDEQPEA